MLFHSPEFILLMIATLALYAAFPKARLPILAVANLFFYGVSGWEYLLLFLAVSAFTHYAALQVGKPSAKLWLLLSVVGNLLNLAIFKYTNFAMENIERIAHLGIDPKFWQVVLPVGISFYTFQLIAYVVDVHRGDLPPAKSLIEFWVFIAFFGQLIAGPIMRGQDFLPQVVDLRERRINWDRIRQGAALFALGMGKKVLFSDMLAPRTDAFFTSWAALNGAEAWIAGLLFAFQIYFDFSAYSDMALGIGHLFGFDLTANFKTPYLSRNPAEFWQRWHITLSSWIRDYIYIPLGGNRRGQTRAYFNLVAAMVLSGLWHGAAWTFIAWGLFHGLLSAFHKLWNRSVKLPWTRHWLMQGLSVLLMFAATTIGWIFFRADGMTIALRLIGKMLTPSSWIVTPLVARYIPILAALAVLHIMERLMMENAEVLYSGWRRWVPTPVRALVYTAIGALLLIMTNIDQSSFIYFRF